MKYISFFRIAFLLCLFPGALWAQPPAYGEWIAKAERFHAKADYRSAGEAYGQAFLAFGDKGYITDRYQAACVWALAGEVDSAFVQLDKIARSGHYTDYEQLQAEPDLQSLRDDPRWEEVSALVRQLQAAEQSQYNWPLVHALDSIFEEDQYYRQQLNPVAQQYGWESGEVQALLQTMAVKDSVNLQRVRAILDEHGWLAPEVISERGNLTLFLVIQHADLATQERYLPMMRAAVAAERANAGNLALLEDRVALRQGKHQVYGSQIGRDPETGEHYVLPLAEPRKVDERRAAAGLGPLAEYVARWGITWDPEVYLERLPVWEAKYWKLRE